MCKLWWRYHRLERHSSKHRMPQDVRLLERCRCVRVPQVDSPLNPSPIVVVEKDQMFERALRQDGGCVSEQFLIGNKDGPWA
jgi:hypothetical protein